MSASSDHEGDARPRPPLWLRVATPIVVLIVLLLVVEAFLWIAMPVPYSSRLFWEADGHVKARLEPGQGAVNVAGNPVEINELGFRGPMPSWAPAPGTIRIVTLGGSSTFCFDASDDAHTWPALLEARLDAALDVDVEVVNLGLPGYDTSNSKVNYLFTGRALHPHVVVVYHTWNDMKFLRLIDETEGAPRWLLSGRATTGTNPSALARMFRGFQIVQRVRLSLDRMKRTARENEYTSQEQAESAAHAPASADAWAWFEHNFVDVARFASSDGALPVLVSQATLARAELLADPAIRLAISNDLQRMTLPRLAESWVRANRVIEEVAGRENAVFVDGHGAVPADLEHMKDHVHLLDAGSERLATAIAQRLLADERFLRITGS